MKEVDFERLNGVVEKLVKKFSESEKCMIPEDNIEDESDETNLDITFLNPSLENKCDMCDFVAKNIRGLKIHKTSKHTKVSKYKCETCNIETNSKKLNSDHKVSKCSKTTICEFCSDTFETEEKVNMHMKENHPKVKDLHCDLCEFETNIKKLFQDHKASNCLKIILCDFGCGETFETEDEINNHMKAIHW